MKPFVKGPRIVKSFDEAQTVVYGPEFGGKQRELVGVFTGDFMEGNALLDSLAPDLYAVLKEILESPVEPPLAFWKRAQKLIDTIDKA